MKRVAVLFGLSLLLSAPCFADEPAVLNDPANAFAQFKKVVSMAEPSGDAIWDVAHPNEFKVGSSLRLYSAEKLSVPVLNDLDIRLGWMETKGIYGALSIALDRATGKDILKYVHVGWMFGFSGDKQRDTFVTGPTVGAKVGF